MKISYNWLKEYILNLDLTPETIAEKLTDCGLEVEGIEKFQLIRGGLEGLVVGEVKTKDKHPDADKLSLTTVDVGSENLLQVVCGAPNVEAGQRVIVATPGTLIYPLTGEPFEIKKSKIRGQVSEGMICAEDEIGLGTSHDGIIILNSNAKIGSLAKDYYGIKDDFIFEIGLTPNRADAASHWGVARDLVAVLNFEAGNKKYKLERPSTAAFKKDNDSLKINVRVENEKDCPRYSGVTISGIKVKESPEWLTNKIKSIGLRPINNIVDVTNFVLHEMGQPLHAFDADKITGKTILVKKVTKGSKFKTLDDVDRELTGDELMICNEQKPMCMAGIYGGIDSGVTETTQSVFLESAYFESSVIRKASKIHDLKTDASFRYERGTDPNITIEALKRAALLFKEVAGGVISSDIIDIYPTKINPFKVELSYKNCENLIGKAISKNDIKNILELQNYELISEKDSSLELGVPSYKVDVKREQAVIEDVLRIYGFNNIESPTQIKSSIQHMQGQKSEVAYNLTAELLTSNGFFEVVTNSLTKNYVQILGFDSASSNVEILNPLSSELQVMRQEMIFSLLELISYNQNRKLNDLKVYELGKTYHKNDGSSEGLKKYGEKLQFSLAICGKKHAENWTAGNENVSFYSIKSDVVRILKRLGVEDFKVEEIKKTTFNYGVCLKLKGVELATIGEVKKSILKHFDITQPVFYAELNWELILKHSSHGNVKFKELSKFPEVRRDLALLVNKEVKYSEIEHLAFQAERKLLKEVNLFDVYEGDKLEKDKKSYAVSFTLQDHEATLTDKQIEKIIEKLVSTFEKHLGAKLR